MKKDQEKFKIGTRTLAALKPAAKPYEVTDEDLPGFILRVQPNGNKLYYVYYRTRDGQRRRMPVGSAAVLTTEQAREQARRLLAEAQLGNDPAMARRKGITLKSFLEQEYKPWAITNLRSGGRTVQRLVAAFSDLLALPLEKVNAWQLKKWSTKRLNPAEGRGVKPATVNRDTAHLRAALSKAFEWGHVDEHPLSRVKLMREDDNRIVRYLSEAEEKRLMDALDKREEKLRAGRDSHNVWLADRGHEPLPSLHAVPFADHLKPMVLLTLKTGLRRGELFSLCWEDIALDRATLTVHGHGAKSGRTRHIPVTPQTVDLLRQWQRQTSGAGLVFPGHTGGEFDNCNKAWHGVLKVAGLCITERDPATGKERVTEYTFRWHDMRHHYASKLAMNGASLSVIRELLGHQDMKMTLRYAHLSAESKAAAVLTLDRPANVVAFAQSAKGSRA